MDVQDITNSVFRTDHNRICDKSLLKTFHFVHFTRLKLDWTIVVDYTNATK